MKISKESTFQPVTIVLETECEVTSMKNIIRYLGSIDDSHPHIVAYGGHYKFRFRSLSDDGRKMYHSLKSGL